MPPRNAIHEIVKQALTKDGWIIKDTEDIILAFVPQQDSRIPA